jgi:hypothetical protein
MAASVLELFENREDEGPGGGFAAFAGRVRGSFGGMRIQRALPERAQDCEKSH